MPKREVETNYWFFRQNNSGGKFRGPRYLFVEATSESEALSSLFDKMNYGPNNYCRCCGERWSYGEDCGQKLLIYGSPPKEDDAYCVLDFSGKAHYFVGDKETVDNVPKNLWENWGKD